MLKVSFVLSKVKLRGRSSALCSIVLEQARSSCTHLPHAFNAVSASPWEDHAKSDEVTVNRFSGFFVHEGPLLPNAQSQDLSPILSLWAYSGRKPKFPYFFKISTTIFPPHSKPCYVEPGNTRSCRHYGQTSCTDSRDTDSFRCACAALILNPTLKYYWYIAIFDRVYLYCCGSVTDETSYVYGRTHSYSGAIRRFDETACSFPHDDVERRKFRVVFTVAMVTVRLHSDSL